MAPLANDRAKAVRFGLAFVSCQLCERLRCRERSSSGGRKLRESLINLTSVNGNQRSSTYNA